jgi:hypothetical protein
MELSTFKNLVGPVIDAIAGQPLDQALADRLNDTIPPESALFQDIEKACHRAIEAGWMCQEGSDGRRIGRVIEATDDIKNLSIDVVDLIDIVGPHHRHPNGEVCMIMPQTEAAVFDGKPAGWCVYPPGSAHHPTVSNGRALVLYLLPNGEIDFTG